MSSSGARNVYTHPVLRSNSKFDVLKNSLSGGQLNSILPSVVSIGSLSFIRSPTLVLRKSGTYQSRAMVPCCRTNSLMASSLVCADLLWGSWLGLVCLVFALGWLHFLCVVPQSWLLFEHLCCCLLTSLHWVVYLLYFVSNNLSYLLCWLLLFNCVLLQHLFSLMIGVQLFLTVLHLGLSPFSALLSTLLRNFLFSFSVGFCCEHVNMWWCSCSIVFEIISWLP